MPSHHHKLDAVTIHITQKEMEELLIKTAQEKSQNYHFAFMVSDQHGGYKLTFVKPEIEG